MPIEDDDPLEAVIRETLAEIDTDPDQVFVPDVHCSGIVECVNVVPVGDLWSDQYRFRRQSARFHTCAVAEEVVGVDRKMRAMLLG